MRTDITPHEKTVQPAQGGCCCASSKTISATVDNQRAKTADLSGAPTSNPTKDQSHSCCGK